MKIYCDFCRKEVCTTSKMCRVTHTVKGDDITVDEEIHSCPDCKNELWVPGALAKVYDAYRERNGLLSSAQIKAIRESYGLTQNLFAKLLGFGEKTITRYENGSIQDVAHDNLLKMAAIPDNFKTLFEQNKARLNSLECRKVEKATERHGNGRALVVYSRGADCGFYGDESFSERRGYAS